MVIVKLTRLLIFLFSVLNASQVLAQSLETAWCFPKKKQTLENYLVNELELSKNILYRQNYLSKLKRWNPNIKDILSIEPGKRLYVEVPYGALRLHGNYKNCVKAARKVAKLNHSRAKRKRMKRYRRISSVPKSKKILRKKEPTGVSSPSSLTMFYTFSKGVFREDVDGVELETNQDSPITIGVSGNYKLSNSWGISASTYFSRLDGASTVDDLAVNIPLEYGVNSYLEYRGGKVIPYFGFDYEKFSTFNVDELVFNERIDTRQHTLTYATVGVAKMFEVFGRKLFAKVGISQSVTSSSDRKSIVSDENFHGQKTILYLNTPIKDNWSTHLLFKHHRLKGATDLNITRTGIGIGYSF